MQFHDSLHNCQAQAKPAFTAVERPVRLRKRQEQLGQKIGLYTHAGIFNADDRLRLAFDFFDGLPNCLPARLAARIPSLCLCRIESRSCCATNPRMLRTISEMNLPVKPGAIV